MMRVITVDVVDFVVCPPVFVVYVSAQTDGDGAGDMD